MIRVATSTPVSRWFRTAIFFAGIIALATQLEGCTSDGGDEASPVGKWNAQGLLACLAEDGRAAFGDQPAEVSVHDDCSWLPGGTITCSDFTATWTFQGDLLVLTADAPCGVDCGPYRYSRDPSVSCFFE